jgi:hypothetical protein
MALALYHERDQYQSIPDAVRSARADYKLHLGQCILYPATVHTNDWVLRRETGHFE